MTRLHEQIALLDDSIEVWNTADYAAFLPTLDTEGNKYSRGHALVAAGSTRYPGAAVLCARAAARAGAGYVSLAVPKPIVQVAQSHLTTVPVEGLESDDGAFCAAAAATLTQRVDRCDAVAYGPGVTATAGARSVLETLVKETRTPLLVDADGLGMLVDMEKELENRALSGASLVITPHEGEAGRLLGTASARGMVAPLVQRIEIAHELCERFHATVVFKGPVTVIVGEGRTLVSDEGTPALATAGTGDVLSGIIVGLMAQGLSVLHAAALGVYLQGKSAHVATRHIAEASMIATDVIDALPAAMLELETDGGHA